MNKTKSEFKKRTTWYRASRRPRLFMKLSRLAITLFSAAVVCRRPLRSNQCGPATVFSRFTISPRAQRQSTYAHLQHSCPTLRNGTP
ncbi:hypothetical protein N7444_011006 [Penicillium canescens]|nr:hypothetical protein N7444_011006 [Penicillium canescens]